MGVRTLYRACLPLFAGVSLTLSGCATALPHAAGVPLRSPPPLAAQLPGPIRTIVLDAGHGGHDPGTSHFGLREKQLTLDIARRLRNRLQDAGVSVVMTREGDQFIPLSRRPAIANRLPADLFVSIHINANPNRAVSGVEVYYARESVVTGSAQWPPAVQPAEIGMPSLTVKQVLWDLVLGRSRASGRRLAMAVCRALSAAVQVPCYAVKPARFVVLREAWIPAVLVEVGYVSNQTEAARLRSPTYREAAAQGIANGVLSYLRELG